MVLEENPKMLIGSKRIVPAYKNAKGNAFLNLKQFVGGKRAKSSVKMVIQIDIQKPLSLVSSMIIGERLTSFYF